MTDEPTPDLTDELMDEILKVLRRGHPMARCNAIRRLVAGMIYGMSPDPQRREELLAAFAVQVLDLIARAESGNPAVPSMRFN